MNNNPKHRRGERNWGSTHSGGANGTGGRGFQNLKKASGRQQKIKGINGTTIRKRSANLTTHFALIAGSQERIVRSTLHHDQHREEGHAPPRPAPPRRTFCQKNPSLGITHAQERKECPGWALSAQPPMFCKLFDRILHKHVPSNGLHKCADLRLS